MYCLTVLLATAEVSSLPPADIFAWGIGFAEKAHFRPFFSPTNTALSWNSSFGLKTTAKRHTEHRITA